MRPAVAQPPLLTSAGLKWEGILLEQHRLKDVEVRDVYALNHVAFLQLSGAAELEWGGELPNRRARFLPGQISLIPALVPFSARSRDAGEFLTVSLDPAFLACATAEYGSLEQLQLRPILAEEDSLMRELLNSFKLEVGSGNSGGELYVQSLATMLAVHLVQRYSGSPQPKREFDGGLSREQLLRTTKHIQERFATPITLTELAALNGISLFHFSRQFKRSTGLSPYEYVTRVRIEKARILLLHAEANLTDVALRVGFYDQSHFSRHFKRVTGTTPAAFIRKYGERKIVL